MAWHVTHLGGSKKEQDKGAKLLEESLILKILSKVYPSVDAGG
jgi:hypothetical protein